MTTAALAAAVKRNARGMVSVMLVEHREDIFRRDAATLFHLLDNPGALAMRFGFGIGYLLSVSCFTRCLLRPMRRTAMHHSSSFIRLFLKQRIAREIILIVGTCWPALYLSLKGGVSQKIISTGFTFSTSADASGSCLAGSSSIGRDQVTPFPARF